MESLRAIASLATYIVIGNDVQMNGSGPFKFFKDDHGASSLSLYMLYLCTMSLSFEWFLVENMRRAFCSHYTVEDIHEVEFGCVEC